MKMTVKALPIAVLIAALAASAASAQELTARVHAGRMTVLDVDRETGRFKCAEHRRWILVSPAEARPLHVGDIVTVTPSVHGLATITVVRTAAEELASPE